MRTAASPFRLGPRPFRLGPRPFRLRPLPLWLGPPLRLDPPLCLGWRLWLGAPSTWRSECTATLSELEFGDNSASGQRTSCSFSRSTSRSRFNKRY
jgi:hypothetical protein